MDAQKYVLFLINGELFGMDIGYVQGIERYVDIVVIPNAPGYIRGLINLRGDVIPVFSLRAKFGLPEEENTEETNLIVAQSGDMMIAFEVDSVKEIVEFAGEQRHKPPEIVNLPETLYLESIASVGNQMVLLLNLKEILSEVERESIQAVMEDPAAG